MKSEKKHKKKKRKILLICLILLAVFIAAVILTPASEENGETVQKGQSDMPEEKAVNTSSAGGAGAEDAAGNGSGTDVYHLPGYINGTEPDGEPIVCGVSLPFQVADTPILIEGIGQYTGPFVEDGTDEPVANVLAVVVKNNSDTDVEYAEIRFLTGDGSEAEFHISALPAGKSALVLEQNRRAFQAEDTLTFADKLYARAEEMPLMEDQVSVTAAEGTLTLKNLTDTPLGTVSVRYKNRLSEDCYLGGIAYSCTFDNVGAGESREVQTKHFSADNSTVLMVKAIQE